MALIQTFQASDLYNLACNMGRGKQFGYDGWLAIGDYLENLSDDTGEHIEIDIIGICCDYSISSDAESWWNEYGQYIDIDAEVWIELDTDDKLAAICSWLNDNTSVVCCNEDCIIWAAF